MFKRSTKETHSGQGWSTEGRISAAAAEEEEESRRRRKRGGRGKGMGLKKRKGVTLTGAVRRVRNSAVPIPYSVSLEDDIF